MNDKKSQNLADRRLALKLFDKGFSTQQILKKVHRSRSWFYKWLERFDKGGYSALKELPKTPKTNPSKYTRKDVALILRVRKRFQKASVGLIHARAIQQEIKRQKLMMSIPSLSTINRWLKAAGLLPSQTASAKESFYPVPRIAPAFVLQSMDWAARYLTGGEKLFAFHTIDLETHAVAQTLASNKTTPTACTHLLTGCNHIGLPDFLQIDNDSAFNAIGIKWGFGGYFMRLCLSLGIEIIFIPPGEPKRNCVIEALNHLWSANYFSRNHFRSVKDALRKQSKFLSWYQNSYSPPSLNGQTVSEAKRRARRIKLTLKQIKSLPKELPLTRGRIHFMRLVSQEGVIKVLGESYKVSKSLAHKYVWATIETAHERMQIFYRKSERARPKLVKTIAYPIAEKVYPLKKEYRRRFRVVDVLKII